MNCVHCNKETNNPKYCSRSCSATHTNTSHPKRKPTGKCKTCAKVIHKGKRFCSKECKPIHISDIKLQDIIYTNHHKSSAFALVRSHARQTAKKLGFNKCSKCGYDKHFEVCHIKAIASFPLDTLISVINNPNNLVPLCPNCHWEHDHNLM